MSVNFPISLKTLICTTRKLNKHQVVYTTTTTATTPYYYLQRDAKRDDISWSNC